jgi:hypothetical protein
MYRQIKVDTEHCEYQRILWRENSEDPILTYRLLTVTYGTTCAPFLAVRCLQQAALEEKDQFTFSTFNAKGFTNFKFKY